MKSYKPGIVVVCLLLLEPSNTKADEFTDFIKDYAPYYERAVAHFWTNVKMKGTRKLYDTDGPGNYQATQSFWAVAGDRSLLYQYTLTDNNTGRLVNHVGGGALTPDAGYEIERVSSEGPIKLVGSRYPWEKRISYYGKYYARESDLAWPFMYTYIGRGPNRYHAIQKPEGLSFTVTRKKFRGLDCVAVSTVSERGTGFTRTKYLRLPDWLVIGEEGVGVFQLSSKSTEPIKKYVEVNYGPPQPDTGLPFPTEVKGWYTTPGGKRFPAEDVTFTQYERYVPKPGEVDVERQFGVTVPPVPPRPPLPPEGEYLTFEEPARTSDAQGNVIAARRGWPVWPLYAVAGGVAIAVAGVLVRRRVRRS